MDDPAKVKDCLRKIGLSGQHLLSLINDVLDMSKIESGEMLLREDSMSLPEVLELSLIHIYGRRPGCPDSGCDAAG